MAGGRGRLWTWRDSWARPEAEIGDKPPWPPAGIGPRRTRRGSLEWSGGKRNVRLSGELWSPLGHLYTLPLILSASLSLRHMRNLSQSPSMGNTPLVGQLYTSIRLNRIFLFPSSEVTTVGLGLCVVVVVVVVVEVTSIFNCFSAIESSLTQTVFGFNTT